jgi:hypothetical protein
MLHQPLDRDPANEAVRLVDAAATVVPEPKRKGVSDFVWFGRTQRRRVGHRRIVAAWQNKTRTRVATG